MSDHLEIDTDGEETIVIVDEDGTIHAEDPQLWLVKVARAHREANEQIGKWRQREEAYERTLMRYHPDAKTVQYGPTRVTRVEKKDATHYHLNEFVDALLATELTEEEWSQTLRAFKSVERDSLPDVLKGALDSCAYSVPREPHILTTTVVRRLP